jgi:hypothetical protein
LDMVAGSCLAVCIFAAAFLTRAIGGHAHSHGLPSGRRLVPVKGGDGSA